MFPAYVDETCLGRLLKCTDIGRNYFDSLKRAKNLFNNAFNTLIRVAGCFILSDFSAFKVLKIWLKSSFLNIGHYNAHISKALLHA